VIHQIPRTRNVIIYVCSFLIGCAVSRPLVRIAEPAHDECVGGTIDIHAAVTGEGIVRVEFYIDGVFHATSMHPPFRTAWETYVLQDSTFHTIIAKAYDLNERINVSKPVSVLVDNTHGKPRNTLSLVSGYINTAVLDVSDPVVTVLPGEAITGDIVVRADNRGDPDWGAPLGGTPTWGDHITGYWDTDIWLPGGVSEHTIDLFLRAPGDTGQYYIFIAWGHETDCAHVMALSYWRYAHSPEWHDGNDIADWGEVQAHMAIDSGYVRSRYRYDEHGYGIKSIAAAAIRVLVIAP
jgi:hypothetical protein